MKCTVYAFWRLVWYCLYAAGAVAILIFWWHATGHETTTDVSSIEIAVGNVAGLIGTYCILWQLVLLSRLTLLEDVFGMEKLTVLHKWNGYTALTLILVHGLFLTVGFALIDHLGIIGQFLDFLNGWEGLLTATVSTALLITIVFISIGMVRRHFKYETWYLVHLFTYLAILLAFSHQLAVGSDFARQPAFTAYWYALYVAAVGVIVLYRFVRPAYLVYKYRFRVEKIVRETPDIVSIYITGRRLERLRFKPGQFMIWRFLSKDLWWQAHPFSLSAAPNGKYLRLTVKQLGDFTRSLSGLKPGTLVSPDGPHGNFTAARFSQPNLLLIAGGVGITPIRSTLEQLPAATKSVVLLYATRTRADIALRAELDALSAKYGGVVHYVLSDETAPGMAHGFIDDANLQLLVPDAATREVMLCGPPPMMDAVTAVLVGHGVSRRHIHTERFAY